MKKGIFKKAEFYSYIRKDGENRPVKHRGYTDGEYYYYYYSNGVWFAVDDYTGLAICNEETLDKCYQKVHDECIQNLLKKTKNSERYAEQCSEWYDALVEEGVSCMGNYILT